MDQFNFRRSFFGHLVKCAETLQEVVGCPTQHCGVNCLLLAATVETLED